MKQPDAPTEQDFLKHVASHKMTVILDEGLHRHLRFKKPETTNQYFDLITWPGSLCFTGDMGTYVFRRTEDMFTFFRSDYNDDGLHVNLQYWAEKLDATDTDGGHEKFSPEAFRENVIQYLKDSEHVSRATRQAIKDRVLNAADDGEYAAYAAACNFEHNGFHFDSFYEVGSREYTYHFVWCCYALVWAIKQYDALVATATKQAA